MGSKQSSAPHPDNQQIPQGNQPQSATAPSIARQSRQPMQQHTGIDADDQQSTRPLEELRLADHNETEQGQRQTEGDEQEQKASRTQHPDGAHPTGLVTDQFHQRWIVVTGRGQIRRQNDLLAELTDRRSELIVIGYVIGNTVETADGLQGLAAQTQGLT